MNNQLSYYISIGPVDRTKPIAIGKEVYAMEHDFLRFFKKKNAFEASKMVLMHKKTSFLQTSPETFEKGLGFKIIK